MDEDAPLLELQQLDLCADALLAQRASLPERAALQQCEAELLALARAREEAEERRTALGREERRIETLVEDLEAHAREVEGTLYSGKVKAVRELEALQAELASFQRRQHEQEDAELALLEQEEKLDAEIAGVGARSAACEARAAELRGAIAAAESRIDAELAALLERRAALQPRLAAPCLAVYEKLRGQPKLAGRVTASAAGGTCRGCMNVLPTTVASLLQRHDTSGVVQCPRCSRILLR